MGAKGKRKRKLAGQAKRVWGKARQAVIQDRLDRQLARIAGQHPAPATSWYPLVLPVRDGRCWLPDGTIVQTASQLVSVPCPVPGATREERAKGIGGVDGRDGMVQDYGVRWAIFLRGAERWRRERTGELMTTRRDDIWREPAHD